jgi:hypothetical protein
MDERTYYDAPPAVSLARVLVPVAMGGVVSITLGMFAKLHAPTGIAVSVAGFSSPQTVKVWLATAAALFGVVQLVSALAMYGKLGLSAPPWVSPLHRWSGRIAFLLTVPVAVHCLYALGFADYDTRTLAHSLFGCLFFGVFTVKMLILPKQDVPGWVLPVAGGVLFTVLMALWETSALWFFTTFGVKL